MTEKNNSLVLLSLVAIVAIVGLVVFMRGPGKTPMTPVVLETAGNVGGQAFISPSQMVGSAYAGESTPLAGGSVSCFCSDSYGYYHRDVSCKSEAECEYRCNKACGSSELRSYTIKSGTVAN